MLAIGYMSCCDDIDVVNGKIHIFIMWLLTWILLLCLAEFCYEIDVYKWLDGM